MAETDLDHVRAQLKRSRADLERKFHNIRQLKANRASANDPGMPGDRR